jgi:hypothetical protein
MKSSMGLVVGSLACSDLTSALVLLVLGSGCATPLQEVVSGLAPDYRAKAPAVGESEVGRALVKHQVATNSCFLGTVHSDPLQSWTTGTVTYKSALDAKLKVDFGSTLRAEANAGPQGSIKVSLSGVTQTRLDDLYFIPASGCDQFVDRREYLEGKKVRVITRALMASTVAIDATSTQGLGVSVDTRVVKGNLGHSSEMHAEWSGTELYFADYPEKIIVRRAEVRSQLLAVNQPVDLGACGFTLRAIQADGWQGDFSCTGGQTNRVQAALGNFATWNTEPGVTYSARVNSAGVAQGNVDLFQFVVKSP